MGKFAERESRRRASIVGSIVGAEPSSSGAARGCPKADRETKKRISLSVLPSLYKDIQKIAYIQRRSASDLMAELMEGYRNSHLTILAEYEEITPAMPDQGKPMD